MKAKKKKTKKAGSAKKVKAVVESAKTGKTVGKTTGLGVSAFWNQLLATNAASPKRKLTDQQIAAAVKAEFPARKTVQPVGRVRSFFNRGVQGYGNPPGSDVRGTKKQSVAYDSKGKKTVSRDWGSGEPDARLSKVARQRAAKVWAKKKAVKKPAPKKAAGKGKKAKMKVKKAA